MWTHRKFNLTTHFQLHFRAKISFPVSQPILPFRLMPLAMCVCVCVCVGRGFVKYDCTLNSIVTRPPDAFPRSHITQSWTIMGSEANTPKSRGEKTTSSTNKPAPNHPVERIAIIMITMVKNVSPVRGGESVSKPLIMVQSAWKLNWPDRLEKGTLGLCGAVRAVFAAWQHQCYRLKFANYKCN